jgi:dihydrodipicolinate synthase/N-acetylneuraminate lyase
MTSPPAIQFISPPEGLIVDLVTPLTGGGKLDRPGLARLLDRGALAANGILVGSPLAGEALELPLELRRQLLSEALQALGGRKPLFFCITGISGAETRELARAVQEECQRRKYAGRVFLADLPLWYHSNRGLPQMYQGLQAEAPLPVVLLNLPRVVRGRAQVFKHLNLRTQVFKKAAALPGIVGLIYQGEMRRFLNYHHAAAGRPGFAFYEADEARFLTRPGTWGVISGGAQLLPGIWPRVARACLHPEELADDPGRYELWDLSQQLLRLAQVYQDAPAALAKHALAAQGVIADAAVASGTLRAAPDRQKKFLDLLASFYEGGGEVD